MFRIRKEKITTVMLTRKQIITYLFIKESSIFHVILIRRMLLN